MIWFVVSPRSCASPQASVSPSSSTVRIEITELFLVMIFSCRNSTVNVRGACFMRVQPGVGVTFLSPQPVMSLYVYGEVRPLYTSQVPVSGSMRNALLVSSTIHT